MKGCCRRQCLKLAISKGKIGEEVGISIGSRFTRKYCTVCETYFGISTKVT
jgi:hypothetical protein